MRSRVRWVLVPMLVLAGAGVALWSSARDRGRPCRLSPARFDQLALRENLPLLWTDDANGNRAIDAEELRILELYPTSQQAWVSESGFTPAFDRALVAIVAAEEAAPPTDPIHAAVRARFDRTQLSLVEPRMDALTGDDERFLAHVRAAGAAIDALYDRQVGADVVLDRIPASDVELRSAARLDRASSCGTASETACTAIDGGPAPRLDAYPLSDLAPAVLCRTLGDDPDAAALLSPFTVVREEAGQFRAIPYRVQYAALVATIASELRAAAGSLPAQPVLARYLETAADAFERDDWSGTEEAFAALGREPGPWYAELSVEPVPGDPCFGAKRTFALVVGRRDEERSARLASRWAALPLAQIEATLAGLIAPSYAIPSHEGSRSQVIDPVLLRGAVRRAYHLRLGMSRGEASVLMPALCDDACERAFDAREARMLDASSYRALTDETRVLAIDLHEIAHRLGPGTARFHSATPGPTGTAAMSFATRRIRELHAATLALFLVGQLHEANAITTTEAQALYAHLVTRAVEELSTREQPAPQDFATILPTHLFESGALRWASDASSAEGARRGALVIDFSRLPDAVGSLERALLRIMADGDLAAMAALAERAGQVAIPYDALRERGGDTAGILVVFAL